MESGHIAQGLADRGAGSDVRPARFLPAQTAEDHHVVPLTVPTCPDPPGMTIFIARVDLPAAPYQTEQTVAQASAHRQNTSRRPFRIASSTSYNRLFVCGLTIYRAPCRSKWGGMVDLGRHGVNRAMDWSRAQVRRRVPADGRFRRPFPMTRFASDPGTGCGCGGQLLIDDEEGLEQGRIGEQSGVQESLQSAMAKIGRNDPCPCGNGQNTSAAACRLTKPRAAERSARRPRATGDGGRRARQSGTSGRVLPQGGGLRPGSAGLVRPRDGGLLSGARHRIRRA